MSSSVVFLLQKQRCVSQKRCSSTWVNAGRFRALLLCSCDPAGKLAIKLMEG